MIEKSESEKYGCSYWNLPQLLKKFWMAIWNYFKNLYQFWKWIVAATVYYEVLVSWFNLSFPSYHRSIKPAHKQNHSLQTVNNVHLSFDENLVRIKNATRLVTDALTLYHKSRKIIDNILYYNWIWASSVVFKLSKI